MPKKTVIEEAIIEKEIQAIEEIEDTPEEVG
jgi:hypothetical protein